MVALAVALARWDVRAITLDVAPEIAVILAPNKTWVIVIQMGLTIRGFRVVPESYH
jgi:hypothetical protein